MSASGKYFKPRADEKITEKMLYRRIGMSVLLIVTAMVAVSLSAFAYFTADVTSGVNTITSAYYDLDIAIGGVSGEYREYTMTGTENLLTVVLTYDPNKPGIASTGFCVVKIGDDVYHTVQLGADETADNGERLEIEFFIKNNSGESIQISFVPHWGTSSRYGDSNSALYIRDGDTVTVGAQPPTS